MTTRSASSSSSIVLIIILVLTFPLWFGLGAGLFGLIIGLLGAVFGVIMGIFGALLGLMVLPFRMFGWGHIGWFPHFHFGGFLIAIIIVLGVLLIRARK